MQVRFFNQNTATGEALLIGLRPNHLSQAEMYEAVRVATDEDIATYREAWESYLAAHAEPAE